MDIAFRNYFPPFDLRHFVYIFMLFFFLFKIFKSIGHQSIKTAIDIEIPLAIQNDTAFKRFW